MLIEVNAWQQIISAYSCSFEGWKLGVKCAVLCFKLGRKGANEFSFFEKGQ